MGTTTILLTESEPRLAGTEQVKHTPGPWIAEPQGGRGAWIKGANGEWAALSCGNTDEHAAQNGRLIAAAPDMLAALKECSEELAAEIEDRYAKTKDHPAMKRRYDRDMDAVVTARAAIAKAEGRTP